MVSSKGFTAQEMREAADTFWVGGVICEVKDEDGRVVKHIKHDAIIAMLRQAADAMEREARREKKYEYKVLYRMHDGRVSDSITYSENIQTAREVLAIYSGYDEARIVSREVVGEWEAVRDGE